MSTGESPTVSSPEPSHDGSRYKSDLEEYELESNSRLPFLLTVPEMKLLSIAGVGFFLDAYDLFIINPVATMLQYRLYNGAPLPAGLQGFMKAGANIGSVIGQFTFGFAADYFGRKAVYGKELMLIIFATIMCISDPTGDLSPSGALLWLSIFRIVLGVGVGGDYPMSASVTTDRSSVKRRGTMLAYIFANQGWGSFVGALVTIIVLACYKGTMEAGHTSKVDGVWRIVIGLSLIPAFATLYQRLTLPESKRFKESQRQGHEEEEIEDLKQKADADIASADSATKEKTNSVIEETLSTPGSASQHSQDTAAAAKRHHFHEFVAYYREWRHFKILMGTCICWFLLDIAFYGINLNQNVVLQQIGFDGKSGTPWNKLFKIATGNLIITALGFVPGYYATILTIEYLGRKWIQIQGFLMAALFLGILAGKFYTLSTVSFIVCFSFLQFFFNFGANTTSYCYPAEVFPTKFRAASHGISAACGKVGAIISALAFNQLSESVGTPVVLWIFFGCCIFGALFTLLLPEVKGRDPDLVYQQEQEEAALRHLQ